MKKFKIIFLQIGCTLLVILGTGKNSHAFLGDWLIGAHEKCQEVAVHPSKKVNLPVLIDCFTPPSPVSVDTSEIDHLQQDMESIRRKTELWLYMMNASGKIIEKTTKNKSNLLKLSDAQKTGRWGDDEQLIDQENSFQLMIALQKARKVDEFYHQACSKERLKNQSYCSQIATNEYQQNMQILKQQLELLPTQNPLLFDSTIQEKIDEFSDLTKEERKGLVKDLPINPFAGKENHSAFFRQEFPNLLQRAQQANEETFKRHQPVLARQQMVVGKKGQQTIVEMEDLLSNQKLIYDYLATKYQPQAIFVADQNQKYQIAELSYANCRIVLQNSVNDLNEVFKSASLDLAMIAGSFGIAGAARLLIANAPKVAALFAANVRSSRLMYYGSESAIAASEAARLFFQNQKCSELLELGVVMSEAPKNLTEQEKDCQSLLQMQTFSYALAALGAVVGIKFSKIDITQFRLERVNRLNKGNLLSDLSKTKALANNPPPGLIQALEPSQEEKAVIELDKIFQNQELITRLQQDYRELLRNVPEDEESKKYALGIVALLERKSAQEEPALHPEQLRKKIAQQFAEQTKLCRIKD